MMTGEISPTNEAILRLPVGRSAGEFTDVEVVIDTGFSEYLTMSPAKIVDFALAYEHDARIILGDGNAITLRVFKAAVQWNGQEMVVPVHESEGGALVGMSLLSGCRVTLDVIAGGSVTIEPLP